MSKILIIEDDKDIIELIEYNLKLESYEIEAFHNGRVGYEKVRKIMPDLVILDLMLPDMDGLDICRKLKSDEQTKHIPVMMLTAKGEEVDRVVGFEIGADDYLTKPFSPRELSLRIKAILRRVKGNKNKASSEDILEFGPLTMDPERFRVYVKKKEVILTATEFKLLYYLIKTKGRVASRDRLLDQVWGYDSALTTRTVDTHVKRLRSKLGRVGDYIETIRGIGYRFKEEPSL